MMLLEGLFQKALAAQVLPNTESVSINDIIVNALTKYIVPLAAALAVGFVIYGGAQYIMSGGDPEKTLKAKKTILWAIVAVIIIVLTVPIVNGIIDVTKDQIIK